MKTRAVVVILWMLSGLAASGAAWISAVNQKIAGEEDSRLERAADGTSWFAKAFELAEVPAKAVITASGLGVFELYVNGEAVGTEILKPGFTDIGKTKYAFSYEVTHLLKIGRNVVSAEVSSGWWRDAIMGHRGKKSALWCDIELTASDGTITRIGSDTTWRASVAGAVTHAGIFDGEEYDARIPQPVFGSSDWPAAEPNGEFKGEILSVSGGEVVLRRDLSVKRGPFSLTRGEKLVVDFGQNMAGVPEFVFRAKAGVTLTCLPAETVNDADAGTRGCDGPKGSVYRANLRIPNSGMRLVYTFADNRVSLYRPRFTYFGYRYIELSATDDVEIVSVTSIPVTSITREMEIGSIETGDPALNRFISNCRWGQLSNYLSVPTDCPQRNERLGWTADAQVFAEAGGYNADTVRFFRKWMRDMRDSMSPQGSFSGIAPIAQYGARYMRFGWSDAGVIVPYTVWRQFGDTAIVRENWAAMVRYVDHVAETRYAHQAIKNEVSGRQYADWLSFEDYEVCSGRNVWGPGPAGHRPLTREAECYWDFLGGCYWLSDARQMAEMAKGIGDATAAEKYGKMANDALAYLRERFVDPKDGQLLAMFRPLQTPAVFALKFGLLADEHARESTKAALRANIAAHDGCLTTGFLGTSLLMDALTENGMADTACDLLLNHKFPSWLYSVDQGATTVWERWNSYTKKDGFGPVEMNSFNHYAYGAVLAWMYRSLAGIASDSAAPGFKHIVMKPVFDRRFKYVKASYRSAAGLITSEWRYEGDAVVWTFTIPEGATATVILPDGTREGLGAGSYQWSIGVGRAE